MTQAIPISQIVTANPAVVGTGGNPLSLNAIFLTTDSKVPTSDLLTFSSTDDVADYFGSTALESSLADNYFLGFENSTKKPGTLFFAGYATAARAAFVRGRSLSGTTLTQLQTVNGTLSFTIDGVVKSGSVNLSAATSFTNAATLIETIVTCVIA